MSALGIILSAILAAIAALHLLWAARVWWPIRDEAALAHAVAGFRGMATMPDALSSAVVALAIMVCALLPANISYANGFLPVPEALTLTATGVAALVFLGRGVAGFTPAWARLTPEEPFRTLDRRYYSPLCIIIGLGFAVLICGH